MILLFAQCEKEEMIVKKEYQPAGDAAQDDPHVNKGGSPGKPDGKTVETHATITVMLQMRVVM